MARLVAAVWFASTLTLFAQQWREARAPHPFGPQIAEEDRAMAGAVLDGCRSRVGGDDVLGIAFSPALGAHQYLTFRLAYLLYPTSVIGVDYPHDGVAPAVAALLLRHPTYLLVLGRSATPPPGDRKSTRLNSSHVTTSRMPSSA